MAPLTREQVTNIGTSLAGNKEARDIVVSAAQDRISRQSETASSVGGNLAAGITTINSNNLKPTPVVNPTALPPNPTNTRINAATNISEAQAIPPKAPATSLQDKTQQFLQDQLGDGGRIDTQSVREELRLDEKRQRANDLDNKVIATKRRYEEQIEELEKNPEGKLRGNLNQQINKLSQEANKDLANLSFQYKIANDDLNGARETYNARVADMKDFRDYQFQVYNATRDALQNDLTASEKLTLDQNFKIQQDETNFEQQKELADYNAQIARNNAVFSNSLTTPDAPTVADYDAALGGNAIAIEKLGYDPRDLPVSGDVSLKVQQTDSKLNRDLESIQALQDNKQAINLSAGSLKGGFLSSFLETGTGSVLAENVKADFLNEVKRMTGEYTLNNLIAKKAEGATFGALSNAELGIISASASKLNAVLDIDSLTGEIVGISGTENALKEALDDFNLKIIDAIDLNNSKLLSRDELSEINSI